MRRKDFLARRKILTCQSIIAKINERDYSVLFGEYEEICKIKDDISSGHECFLDDHDAEILAMINTIIQGTKHITRKNESGIILDKHVGKIIESFSKKPKVITSIERRVSALQRLFKMNGSYNVLYGFTIITTTGQSEDSFRKLFPNGTREEIEYILSAAISAYEHVLNISKGSTAS